MAYTITDLGLTVSVLDSLTSDTQYYPKIEFEALLTAGNGSVAIQRRLTQSFNGYPGTGATYSRLNGLSFNYTEVTTPSAVSNALLYEALRVMFANISSVAGTVTSVTGNVVDNTIPTAPVVTAMSTALTHAATSKATPVDADELPLIDSAASFGLKRLTWANLKATLKTYFDTLYQAALGYTAENTASKDATGGYAGLTLFKINFKNAANTFTNFFTNASTAARTYTFPDKDITVAGIVDIPAHPTDVTVYRVMWNQTGTADPVATNAYTEFGGTTFTPARTSAGVYTMTASAPTFTANKTAVIKSADTSGLFSTTAVVTSTTVITITTGLLTAGVAVPTDAQLINTLFVVNVFS